jgi:sugar phosphate isomerase/epimerase
MLSAITVCLVPEARNGPFVFHSGLEDGCQQAARYGFDAVEIFPISAAGIDVETVRQLLDKYSLKLAALGTGAGWLTQQLSLTAADADTAARAQSFIGSIIDVAGKLGAPAIIGSMQGRIPHPEQRLQLMDQLSRSIESLSQQAAKYEVPLLIEPLNRYETNVFTNLAMTVEWIHSLKSNNVRILADMFHMNIEEADIPASIRQANQWIGHVHFADSNRRAIGLGHTAASEVVQSLRDVGYTGYLSAEVLPLPDADVAAQETIRSFRNLT